MMRALAVLALAAGAHRADARKPPFLTPPTADAIRRIVEVKKDTLMLACAGAALPAQVTVHVEGGHDETVLGEVTSRKNRPLIEITAPRKSDAFARCFATKASADIYWPDGPFGPGARAFAADMTFSLDTPEDVLERLARGYQLGERCAPRAGALSKTATITIRKTAKTGLEIRATTSPKNAAIETCLQREAATVAEGFRRVAHLAYLQTLDLVRTTPKRVHDLVARRGPELATDCSADGAPASVTVTVDAKADDKAFTLTADAGPGAFTRCLTDQLQAALRADLSVDDYFRIDNKVHTEVVVAVETRSARLQRIKAERDEQLRRIEEAKQRRALEQRSEVVRVRSHLVAARELVSAHDVSALTAKQQRNRTAALGVLDRYIERGEFPVRTDDAYPGLRPRFIDARGVHCAVGEMIAQTGHEALAREINARFQYSYVRDIDAPKLLAWAGEYGFTVDELARIQPEYTPPPSEGGIRREIDDQKDRFMLACTDGLPPKEVTVHVECNATNHGSVLSEKRLLAFSAPAGSDAFARCFAAGVNSGVFWPGGAFHPSPHDFSTDMTFQLHTLSQVLASRLREHVDLAQECAPRAGALAKTATISITDTTEDGFAISVSTAPKNSAIEACIHDAIEKRTEDFRKTTGLAYKQELALARMTSARVHDAILLRTPGVATDCYTDGLPASLTVSASAKPDDKAFTLATSSTNETFGRCVLDKLGPALRKHFTVGGYFRIDNDIKTDVAISIESPTARDDRLAKARKEGIRKRRELEAEIRRHKYGF